MTLWRPLMSPQQRRWRRWRRWRRRPLQRYDSQLQPGICIEYRRCWPIVRNGTGTVVVGQWNVSGAISEQFQSSFRATPEQFPSGFTGVAIEFSRAVPGRACRGVFHWEVRSSFRATSEQFPLIFRGK